MINGLILADNQTASFFVDLQLAFRLGSDTVVWNAAFGFSFRSLDLVDLSQTECRDIKCPASFFFALKILHWTVPIGVARAVAIS